MPPLPSQTSLWETVKCDLKGLFPDDVFQMWFEPMTCLESTEDSIVLGVPNDFAAIWIHDNYLDLLSQRLRLASGRLLHVSLRKSDPVGIVGVFAMIAPVAVLFAAVLLAVALFAKSYKEAQSYVSPLIIIVIMPAVVGMLPGIELSAKTALIPILNLSLVCKEMLSGVWNWPYIGLIFGSSCLYAGIALAFAVKMFNREDVMFRA